MSPAAARLLPRLLAGLVAAVVVGAPALPATAQPARPEATRAVAPSAVATAVASTLGAKATPPKQITPAQRPPIEASKDKQRQDFAQPRVMTDRVKGADTNAAGAKATAATCNTSDFTTRTGKALVTAIKAAEVACINTLFQLAGSDAHNAFREAQMVTVAQALRNNAVTYPGNNSTGTQQVVLFLRAGYFVQFYDPTTVGPYGPPLKKAIRAGLDRFFASPHSKDVSDANGAVLGEAVILIDSSAENARYLYVVKRLLNAYKTSYNQYWYMVNAVNSVFTVLFRGHQFPDFVAAVQANPSVINTVNAFALRNLSLLGTDQGFLTANAGRETTRFLQEQPLRAKVRPMVRKLLTKSSMTGRTAPLWVGVAELADYYDHANCSYYGVCDFKVALEAAALPIRHDCGTITVRAQDISTTNLTAACDSLTGQVAYFHNLARDTGPVADDNNSRLEVVAFHSSDDYQTYAGVLFDIDTNNGGMYLEGDPAVAGNMPRFIAYEAEWLRPTFAIWNLNHEFTHYLDGRYDMYGDFAAGMTTPTVWWVEGVAEYVSYHYRGVPYTAAIAEAGKATYNLSTLWDTTYDNSDSTRVYRWGYLAVRYMLEKHWADVDTLLGYYRVGNYAAARTLLTSTIGSRYDADWRTWLAGCAAGACA